MQAAVASSSTSNQALEQRLQRMETMLTKLVAHVLEQKVITRSSRAMDYSTHVVRPNQRSRGLLRPTATIPRCYRFSSSLPDAHLAAAVCHGGERIHIRGRAAR